MRTASMMVRKSRVEIVICCGGGAEEIDATAFVVPVLGAGGLENTEDSEAGGIGAGGGDVGTESAGA